MNRPGAVISHRIPGILVLAVALASALIGLTGPRAFNRKPSLVVAPIYAPSLEAAQIADVRLTIEREFAAEGSYALFPRSLIENFYLERDNATGIFDGSYRTKDELFALGTGIGVERIASVSVLRYSGTVHLSITVHDIATDQVVNRIQIESPDMDALTDWNDITGARIDLGELMESVNRGPGVAGMLYLIWIAAFAVCGILLTFAVAPPRLYLEILLVSGFLLALFSWIYALNGDMDYVQRFVATSGLLRIGDTRAERVTTLIRYLPSIFLLGTLWFIDFRRRTMRSGVMRPSVETTAPFLTALSAILYALALPNFIVMEGIPALAWFATAPLYLALRRVRPGRGVFLVLFFTGFQALLVNWWQGTFSYISLPFTVGLMLVQSIPFALVLALSVGYLGGPGLIAAPLFWTAWDWVRSLGFLGYPWGILGVSQYSNTPVIQAAAFGGVWMVSFLPHFSGAAIAFLADYRRYSGRLWRRFIPVTAAAVMVAAAWISGVLVIRARDAVRAVSPDGAGRDIRILVVQQNTDPRKHDYELSFQELSRLTAEAIQASGPFDLVAWPESGFVPDIRYWLGVENNQWGRARLVRTFLDWQAETGIPLVTGNQDHFFETADAGVRTGEDAANPDTDDSDGDADSGPVKRIQNSALYLGPGRTQDDDRSYYYKIRLVPFTENFPYGSQFPWVAELLHNFSTTQWTPGTEHTVLSAPRLRFSTPICFEDVFPDHVRRFVLAGAEVLVNISNDYWANTPLEGYQHGAHALFRAVENRRPLVRATCSGWTISVDTEGRVAPGWPPFYTPGWTVGEHTLPDRSEWTFYTRFGDWFPLLCLSLWALILTAAVLRGRFDVRRRPDGTPVPGDTGPAGPAGADERDPLLPERLWWKHGVIYQIYPRSFADSNGDGIGDLRGIAERLDYLQGLGVDGIWLSPIHPSPMRDFGYDVSDYLSIDPVYGSMDDFRLLVDQAHRRNIALILDMVFNHTSSDHPWFLSSRSGRDDPKRDWYIWHPGRRGGPPNNWRAAFGGPAWERDEVSGDCYLHLFLKEQPDLNWRNPEVRSELHGVLRHWMDLGVDGFRFDVVNFIVKDEMLRNNPYRLHRALPRRYDQQNHIYDRSRPESHIYLKELRSVLDGYPQRMSVGEVFPNEGVIDQKASAAYLGSGTDELHLVFDFSFNTARFRARAFARILQGQYSAVPAAGWPAHVLSNHDQSRVMTRLAAGNPARMKLLLVMLLTQKGTPFLYYGDEIGMGDVHVPRRRMQDPVGLRYWPLHPGRDRSRTPMPWDMSPGGGFSSGEPWLPAGPVRPGRNVADQSGDPESILTHTKFLIGLRRSRPSLMHGDWSLLSSPPGVLAYERHLSEETTRVVLNMSGRRHRIESGGLLLIAGDTRSAPVKDGKGIQLGLPPLGWAIFGTR